MSIPMTPTQELPSSLPVMDSFPGLPENLQPVHEPEVDPIVGEPGFWNVLAEKLALEIIYGPNWLLVISTLGMAVLTGDKTLAGITLSVMSALNMLARSMSDKAGNGLTHMALERASFKLLAKNN